MTRGGEAAERWLWYFAYGSNLDRDTFVGRRSMRPAEARATRLDGFALVFDLPVGPGERGVANLRPSEGAHVHGVAWRIPSAQAAHLDRTEGVPRAYRRASIDVVDATGTRIAAFTYVSPHAAPGRRPSRRYLGLVLRGARHHALPEAWIAWLRGLELAHDEREDAQPDLPLARR